MFTGAWRVRWRCALVAASSLFIASAGLAENLTQQLLNDARDGALEEIDFLTASLIASGIERPEELEAWQSLYRIKQNEILAAARLDAVLELPRAIHAQLHARILTGRYRAESSDLRHALAGGNYNCLSSLDLYYDLCLRAGVAVEIRLRRGHVAARVLDTSPSYVEPGLAEWNAREEVEQALPTRRLSAVELLGKFYYNRAVELLERGQFEAGLELLETSVQLDPEDCDARSNLVAGLNNWAVSRFRERKYEEAAVLIERGLSLDAAFAPLAANERLVRAMLGK